jgi:hypothetical protein
VILPIYLHSIAQAFHGSKSISSQTQELSFASIEKTAGLCYAVSVSQILLNFCCI